MNTDMDSRTCWPQEVLLDIAVYYERGATDRRTYRLAPCEGTPQVRVLVPQSTGAPLELQRMDWSPLPGRTLYQRSLSVLAVHLFGTAVMPPRARGAPLWQRIRVGVSPDLSNAHQIYFELDVVDDAHATLNYRCRYRQPLACRMLALDVLDADPLRALLRIGRACVRPVLIRSAAPVSAVPQAQRVQRAPALAQQP